MYLFSPGLRYFNFKSLLPLTIILLSPVKNVSRLNQERNMTDQTPKKVLNKYVDFDERITSYGVVMFSLEKALLWIKDGKLKCLNDGFVSYKHAAFHFTRLSSLMDWSCVYFVDYCDYLLFEVVISPNLFDEDKIIYILDGLRVSSFTMLLHFFLSNSSVAHPKHLLACTQVRRERK